MAYVVRPNRQVGAELRHVARQELRRAAASLRGAAANGGVHEARKRVKKVRAVLKLWDGFHKGRWTKDRRRLREAGRTLSGLRDADAIIEAFDKVRKQYPDRLSEHSYAAIRRQLMSRKTQAVSQASQENHLRHTARQLERVRRSAKGWRVRSIRKSSLPDLLRQSFRASRKAMKIAAAGEDPGDVHNWRKRVKTLWYHLRLLQVLAPDLEARIERLKSLETLLGDDHNLEVLCTTIAGDRALYGRDSDLRRFTSAARRQQAALRRQAFALGRRLHCETSKDFSRWVRRRLMAGRTGGTPSPESESARATA
jgi:CHAD domain-containing protein